MRYNLNYRLRVIAWFRCSFQRQYFSGRLKAFLRRTRLFRWSSFDCRDLYERSDQISPTPIRLGIGSASHSLANLGESNFPTMSFFCPRHLRISLFSLLCLSFILVPSFQDPQNCFQSTRLETCVLNVFPFEINFKRLPFENAHRKINVMLFLNKFYFAIILFTNFTDFSAIFYIFHWNAILNAFFYRINMSSKFFNACTYIWSIQYRYFETLLIFIHLWKLILLNLRNQERA